MVKFRCKCKSITVDEHNKLVLTADCVCGKIVEELLPQPGLKYELRLYPVKKAVDKSRKRAKLSTGK
jgi:hypothetical protein